MRYRVKIFVSMFLAVLPLLSLNRKYEYAAERLLGLTSWANSGASKDILFGQLRLVIATMTIEEINSDRDKFLENISKNVDSELKKLD
jgi:uncharacterized membrane protein YqiK